MQSKVASCCFSGARVAGHNDRKWLATNCRIDLISRRQKNGLTACNQAASQTKQKLLLQAAAEAVRQAEQPAAEQEERAGLRGCTDIRCRRQLRITAGTIDGNQPLLRTAIEDVVQDGGVAAGKLSRVGEEVRERRADCRVVRRVEQDIQRAIQGSGPGDVDHTEG